MFKKNVSVLQQRQGSGKDVKQLRKDVQVQYPDLSEDDMKEMFPAKAQISISKLSNRTQTFSIDDELMFFDPDGRGDYLIPTVYALWRYPHMLPTLYTHSQVSSKVLGGADLFLQGLIVPEEGLPPFAAGELMSISIPGNPFPFALGSMDASIEAVNNKGFKGKGVNLLHFYGDQLWAVGSKSKPDASFTPARIFPMETPATASKEDAQSGHQEPENDDSADSTSQAEPQESSLTGETSGAAESVAGQDASTSQSAAGTAQDDQEAESTYGLSLDEVADLCLLAGLLTLPDKDLPIMTSDFYTKHMLPAKPPGGVLDLKKSSYKKLSKLLQKYEKQGLLSQKIIHKKDFLSAVHRGHDAFPSKQRKKPPASKEEPSASDGGSAALQNGSGSTQIKIDYLYRFPSSLRPILGRASVTKEDLFTEDQVFSALQQYAEAFDLLHEDTSQLKLDRLMVANLFNKKDPVVEGNPHPLQDLRQRLLSKLQQYHRASRTTEQGLPIEVVNKGAVKNISIQMEDRMGGRKHVTKLSHVESFALEPNELAAELQRKFQTSCSVQKLPGKSETAKEILIQGDALKPLVSLLTQTYGIEPKFLTTASKGKSGK